MPLFALTLPPALHHELLTLVKVTFIAFVVLSFIIVAAYTARQIARRRLFAPEFAPIPIAFQPALSGWALIGCTLGLILLQSFYYPLIIMVGVGAIVMQNKRTVEI